MTGAGCYQLPEEHMRNVPSRCSGWTFNSRPCDLICVALLTTNAVTEQLHVRTSPPVTFNLFVNAVNFYEQPGGEDGENKTQEETLRGTQIEKGTHPCSGDVRSVVHRKCICTHTIRCRNSVFDI